MSSITLINDWKLKFEQSGVEKRLIKIYIDYIEKLLAKGVPIIFDFDHLCLLLGKNNQYVASVVNCSNKHYRDFTIPKRSGGLRNVTAPYPALADCQRWIYNHILKKVPIHSSAHGFTYKKSILSNARLHTDQEHFLKMDLKDFFPSITINQIITVFQSLGYTHRVSFYLAAICCNDKILPQGAPTSPILSNIVAYSLDDRLLRFARKNNLRYTRYADDLAFSGDRIPAIFIQYISEIISSCGFVVNESKTILSKNKGKRIVTGISIAGSTIKVPREYKRKLRQDIYMIRKLGIVSFVRRRKIKKSNYLAHIIGKIRFWTSVEPNNSFATTALKEFIQLGEKLYRSG